MSLIYRYKFDGPTSLLTTDSSGNSNTLVNEGGVVSANDATYGDVAYFDQAANAYFSLDVVPSSILGALPRSFSFWLKKASSTTVAQTVFEYGASSNRVRLNLLVDDDRFYLFCNGNWNYTGSFPVGTWYHAVYTYDGTTLVLYIDGVQVESFSPVNARSTSETLYIGSASPGGFNQFDGYLSDFRAYDYALSSTEASTLFSDGPNPAQIVATMYTHVADLTWESMSGATTYTVTASRDSGEEVTLASTEELSYSAFNLVPGSSYEFRVYTDIDPSTPLYAVTESTPLVGSPSVDSLLTRLGNDLTLLDTSSIGVLDPFIGQVLSTGDLVITYLGESEFVENADTINVSSSNASIMTPFQAASGAGQSSSLVLPDGSTKVVAYDESTDEVIIDLNRYSSGEQLVLAGLKLSVKQF